MLWRVGILVIGIGFVGYRLALWLEIRKATRAGDTRRVEQLRSNGFGLYRWAVLLLLVFILVLALLAWSSSR